LASPFGTFRRRRLSRRRLAGEILARAFEGTKGPFPELNDRDVAGCRLIFRSRLRVAEILESHPERFTRRERRARHDQPDREGNRPDDERHVRPGRRAGDRRRWHLGGETEMAQDALRGGGHLERRDQPEPTAATATRQHIHGEHGACYRSGITYNAGLKRYLWCQIGPGLLVQRRDGLVQVVFVLARGAKRSSRIDWRSRVLEGLDHSSMKRLRRNLQAAVTAVDFFVFVQSPRFNGNVPPIRKSGGTLPSGSY
jgi:hypothetical protein